MLPDYTPRQLELKRSLILILPVIGDEMLQPAFSRVGAVTTASTSPRLRVIEHAKISAHCHKPTELTRFKNSTLAVVGRDEHCNKIYCASATYTDPGTPEYALGSEVGSRKLEDIADYVVLSENPSEE